MKNCLILILLMITPTVLHAEDGPKNRTIIVGASNNQAQAFLKGLAETEKRHEYLHSLKQLVEEKKYDEAISKLTPLVGDKNYQWVEYNVLEPLIDAYKGKDDWDNVIKYQKKLAMVGQNTSLYNEQISTLRQMIRSYKQKGGTNPETLDERSPVEENAPEKIRAHYKGWTERRINYYTAGYYYRRLHFEEAEKYYNLGLNARRRIFGDDEEDYSFHHSLRNLYMLQGRYNEALIENEWLIKNSQNRAGKSFQDKIALSEFLKWAIAENIDSWDVLYTNNFKGDMSARVAK